MIAQDMLALGESREIIQEISAFSAERKKIVGAENVFNYSIGNPSLPAPAKVNETIIRLVQEMDSVALHSYAPAEGIASIRDAVAERESERAGYRIEPECVHMTCGASASLAATTRAVTCPGDKILVLAPFFPEYRVFVHNAGAELGIVPPADLSMQPDMKALEEMLDEHVKAVIINSPNNPSGAILTEETLTRMGQMLHAAQEKYGHEVFLISDEPYRELVYDGKSVPFVPNFYDNTLICYSFSKSLSLPGERIGYVLIPPCVPNHDQVAAAVYGAARSQGHICTPSLMQYVVAECIHEMPDVDGYDRNRRLLYNALTEMGFACVKPEGAFYIFMEAPGGDAFAFYEKAKKYELFVVPADGFGVEGYVRIAYCCTEEMIRRSLPAFEKLARETLGK